MDIDTKIKELQKDLERLEAELDSINRANYDGHETKTLMAKEKQIREKQSELLKYKKAKEMASTKDSMEILRLSGFTTDAVIDRNGKELKVGDIVAVKTSNPAPNYGRIVRISGNQISVDVTGEDDIWTTPARQAVKLKTSKDADWDARVDFLEDKIRKLSKYGDRDSQQRLKGYQEELKAIQKKLQTEDGYKMEDPKEIEAAIKKVKASGHPNPQYLAGLERALEIAKQERGMKDACGEKVFTKGTDDDDDLSQISKHWSKATIEHILKNASVFKPEVVEEAKRLSKIVKDDDATKEGAIKEYGAKEGSFEDGWKHYRDSKGNIWELVNPQGSFWMMECIRGPRKGDTATFKKEMVESSMTEDACSNKDSAIQKECNEILKLSGFIS